MNKQIELTNQMLEQAYNHSKNNKQEIENSDTCGCFYCRELFIPKEIKNWIKDDKGDTALCPYCTIDAIIANASGFEVNKKLLEELHKTYFK